MKTRFSDEQIIRILRKVEAGVSARERCDRHAISDAIRVCSTAQKGEI
ncbi:transposase [Pantoea allii]